MPLDPVLVPICAAASAAPAQRGGSIAAQRARAHEMMQTSFLALSEPGPVVASVEDRTVPVDGGEIVVRVYTPAGEGPFPGLVYLHGGGFWLGDLDFSDSTCRAFCHGAECVVVSTDYRLAPEYPFPIPTEDAYASLCWAVAHAAELGIDATRVAVGGASAGGNLAAVVALMVRDRSGPPLAAQLLEIPVTDLTMSQPSIIENGEGYLLTRTAMESYRSFYLTDPTDANNPYASPLLADDLRNLPPAIVMTAELDPLRDEGEAYAARLRNAGVRVVAKRWDGHVHGSASMTAILPSARDWRDEVIGALREAFARG